MRNSQKGFTLIELLVVIGIIAILAAIVLVAVNPARQFAISRNTARRNDIYQVLNALYQYSVDYNGDFPASVSSNQDNYLDIGNCSGCLDLVSYLVPTYIPAIPFDPLATDAEISAGTTNYVLAQDSVTSRLVATASATELEATPITITR